MASCGPPRPSSLPAVSRARCGGRSRSSSIAAPARSLRGAGPVRGRRGEYLGGHAEFGGWRRCQVRRELRRKGRQQMRAACGAARLCSSGVFCVRSYSRARPRERSGEHSGGLWATLGPCGGRCDSSSEAGTGTRRLSLLRGYSEFMCDARCTQVLLFERSSTRWRGEHEHPNSPGSP